MTPSHLTKIKVLSIDDSTGLGIGQNLDNKNEYCIFETNHVYNRKDEEVDVEKVKVGKIFYLCESLLLVGFDFLQAVQRAMGRLENPNFGKD